MKEEIIRLIHEINEYEDFEDDTDLFEKDILDSMSLVLLIGNIEEKFNIFIPEELVTRENCSTVEAIVRMVGSLKE